MCGICGQIGPLNRLDSARLAAMVDTLSHRGPDQRSGMVEPLLAMGFSRLAIVDPECAAQPYMNEDGTVVALTAGEIYNHRELAGLLRARGHQLATQCDSEVVPHLYEEFGDAMFEQLDGQFAIVIYDRARDRVVCARDPFGVVPFFYHVTPKAFTFGSEIKAILRSGAVTPEMNLRGLDQVFRLPGLVSPETMFRGISSLRPGHFLTWRPGGSPVDHIFWDLEFPVDTGAKSVDIDEQYWVKELERLLLESVYSRLQADADSGVYLSGGLDSTLLAALIREVRPDLPLRTFSAAVADRRHSEAKFQRMAVRHLGADHRERFVHAFEIQDILERVIWHTETPLGESYDAAALALSGLVRDCGVKTVLTGQGADELFGGYIGYRFGEQHRTTAGASAEHAVVRNRLWGSPTFFYENDELAQRARVRRLYSKHIHALEPDLDCLDSALVDRDKLLGRHDLNRRSYLDLKLRLADHLLGDHGDRMSFANSVETRHPFLSKAVAQLAGAMPVELKVRDGIEKYVVKRVAAGRIPEAIVNREKFGFSAPGSPTLLRGDHPYVDAMLSPSRIEADGYFDPDAVAALRRRYSEPGFRINVPFETDELMMVLTTTILLDKFDLPRLGGRL